MFFICTATEGLSLSAYAKSVLFLNYNFSQTEKLNSPISDGKRQAAQRSTFLCAIFTGILKDTYSQYWSSYLVNSKSTFSFLVVLGKGAVIFFLKDLTWTLNFGISLLFC